MNQLLEIFSTREIATIIWGVLLIVALLFVKGIPKIFGGVLKIAVSKIILQFVSISALNTTLIVALLWKLQLWNITLLKDVCIWFIFSSISITFNVHKAKDFSFFKRIIIDNVKFILIFEFIVNFYTFSLPIELVFVPIVSFIAIMQGVAEVTQNKDENHKRVASCFGKLLSFISLGLIVYNIYLTVTNYDDFLTANTLITFLLPINLTLLSIPFFYMLALYMEYESLFTAIKHLKKYKSSSTPKELIRATLLYANIDINKLGRVRKYRSNFNPDKETPHNFIKRIVRKPQYCIGSNAKLTIFNDITTILKNLSSCGLGDLEEWMMKGGDYYHSSTRFYNFKSSENGVLDNSLQYLLTGEETCIHRIDIMLNIGLGQDHKGALTVFQELVGSTFSILNIPVPQQLYKNIKCNSHDLI